jgi:hypothetical protein
MTVAFILNVTSIKNKKICSYELLFGCKQKLPATLKYSGKIGAFITKVYIHSKLKDRGTPCMFVGYSKNQANEDPSVTRHYLDK